MNDDLPYLLRYLPTVVSKTIALLSSRLRKRGRITRPPWPIGLAFPRGGGGRLGRGGERAAVASTSAKPRPDELRSRTDGEIGGTETKQISRRTNSSRCVDRDLSCIGFVATAEEMARGGRGAEKTEIYFREGSFFVDHTLPVCTSLFLSHPTIVRAGGRTKRKRRRKLCVCP